jgi:NtrC-family two-component system sensor histidine kinase KinB
MNAPSLRTRIRNGALMLLALAALLDLAILPRIYRLHQTIHENLYNKYRNIVVAQQIDHTLWQLQLAQRNGALPHVLSESRSRFNQWLKVEEANSTQSSELQSVAEVGRQAEHLFADLAAGLSTAKLDPEFAALHERLDALIRTNQDRIFQADSRAARLSERLTYEFALGLGLLLMAGAVWSSGLSRVLTKPLTEMAERLRVARQRRGALRLGPQKLVELDAIARELNAMMERLEEFEKLNVERLLYEKARTEAIIESLEDGVVLIDPEGRVTYINEIAALILGLEPKEALGDPFDDLNSNHPHYLKVQAALRSLKDMEESNGRRVEVQLHVRGRDHSYILKSVPLRRTEEESLGTILILQDITFVREQSRARTNLVAELSHDLGAPLLLLTQAAETLRSDKTTLSANQQQQLDIIMEQCRRITQLTDNLFNLAHGEVAAISLRRESLDLEHVIAATTSRFASQLAEKEVTLKSNLSAAGTAKGALRIFGDPLKLSWAMTNLVGNALRRTPRGGKIEIRLSRNGDYVRLEVADSGPEIEPKLRRVILDGFAPSGVNGQQSAVGLGLAIVKEIVEAHGGRFFVESTAEAGNCFALELPAASPGRTPASQI